MKIYTKTGDKGSTGLYGGTRVSKYDLRIEAYGTIDELNAHLGLLKAQIIDELVLLELLKIQNDLFTLGAMLATPKEKEILKSGKERLNIPKITLDDVLLLEASMDQMNESIPEMKYFVLPGGSVLVSNCHIARCVCRRAERISVALSEREEIDPIVLTYQNRLSDYLFVLARKLTYENNIEETPWIPSKKS
ncbi:cob(I)yrinic acid a,c-diamide adenosyltransferase [Urechidicola vernalis]|uniref:Corrinoid adenosyltransferase n=1 Tax=Urechidicola vernalis TaxID=3075600 RepID=A0ABU2Y292_9FLAO|nr:cob(I)yrinic acid a,c-diamide adenosyltransferase [Urechidicola sp. P050]MDT0552324.1 cob(I)yrinic acid a,c-diamide adenosyltransferase [Urechidicola sp. P050]